MLGAILGGIGSIASSILGNKAADKAADKNIKLQKQFAQSGIQWKVNDAKKAGVHPLFALGANTTSFQPVAMGGSVPDLGAMGQNIGNAIDATQDKPTRLAGSLGHLAVQRATLENELLASQVTASKLALSRGNPPFPSNPAAPGTPAGSVDIKASPLEAGQDGVVAAVPNSHQWFKTPEGSFTMVPSQQYKQGIEDNIFYEGQDLVRTRMLPYWSPKATDAPNWAPPAGHVWQFRPNTGDWIPIRPAPRSTQNRNPRAPGYIGH